MWCTTPEISWHNRDPVLSIDVQVGVYETSKGVTFWRFATGGADSHVLIWYLTTNENDGATVKCVTDLERHQKAVNVVRFSPTKDILASGDDESTIILWKRKEDCEFFITEETENKEQWVSWKVLRGHLEDVYDISWSPDSNMLVSGSVDNTAILWDIHKGRSTAILSDHKGFVQGVSWDPCNQYICTISTDRTCRLIDINTKKTAQRVYKGRIPTPRDHSLKDKMVRLFYDDTFKSFFRRLTFSLDGLLIIVPSGIIESSLETTETISNATIVFSRYNLKEPLMVLPSLTECTIAVRCCPTYFKLREDGPTSIISLPYRIVFAVATQHSVLIYDTQQISPIAAISNIHYTRLTDLAWSSDGTILVASSTDGYCSIIHFQKDELGEEYKNENNPPLKLATNNNCKPSPLSSNITKSTTEGLLPTAYIDNNAMDISIHDVKSVFNKSPENVENKSKRLSSDVAAQEKKLSSEADVEETEDIILVYSEDSTSDVGKVNVTNTPKKLEVPSVITNKTPRRVQLITLSSPKTHRKEQN